MLKNHRTWKQSFTGLPLLVVLCGTALLAGCASSPPRGQAGQDRYSLFYEGESAANYATAFPVVSPEEAWRNGDAAARGGDYDRALFEYIRGLRLAREPDGEILYKIGGIHHARKNYRLAELAYRWVLQLKPDHAGAGTGLGLVLLQERHYQAARTELEQVVKGAEPASWRAYNALGILADMDGSAGDAERYYRQALNLNPESAKILNNLGYSRYLAGDWEGAGTALQRAVRIKGDYRLAWRNLGLVYARQKKYRLALEALRRTGDEPQAYNDVGFVAMIGGDYRRALTFFDKAMNLSPSYYVTASENANNARRMLDHGSEED